MNGGCILGTVLVVLVLAAQHLPPAEAGIICGSSGGQSVTYQANLNQLANTFPANASSSPNLYGTAVVGNGTNETVYAIALCRGDLVPFSCLVCLRSGLADALQACPSSVDVTIDYSDACHMRVSNVDFLASTNNSELNPFFSLFPSVASSVADRFNGLVTRLLNATADYATASSTATRFATGVMDVDSDYSNGQFSNIFATAQCTPDLTPGQCRSCLAGVLEEMPSQVFPRNSTGASFVGDRCGLRFATYSFYNVDAMVHLQARPQGQGKRTTRSLVLIIVPVILGGLLALTLIGFAIWRKKRSPRKQALFINVEDMESFESIFIDLPTLRKATSNFDEKNKLGKGGFGVVYKV